MADKRGMMTFDRRPGKRVRVDMGAAGIGWITPTIIEKIIDDEIRFEVRLHLDFPRSIRLDREEVHDANQQRTKDNGKVTG